MPSGANDKNWVLVRAAGAVVAGSAAAMWIGADGWRERALDGWVAGAGVYVALTWLYLFQLEPAQAETHGKLVGARHNAVGWIVLGCAVVSLYAVYEILKATTLGGGDSLRPALTGLLAVVVSWVAVHTVFMVRYADLYYSDDDHGIDFPGDTSGANALRYTDFAYLAFTIGMSYAVSDISLKSHQMRKTVWGHSLVSYVFGVVILGATLNLILGLDFLRPSR